MGKIRLLMVDDEKAFLDSMTKRLEIRELDISAVYNGEEALTEIENNKAIEVVLLDVKMPGIDGIQTLVEIKRMAPLVEVIMLTGHATVDTAIDGMKLGAFDYLLKPCDIDVLVGKIKGAASRKRENEEKIRISLGESSGNT